MFFVASTDTNDATRYLWDGMVLRRVVDMEEANVARFLGYAKNTVEQPLRFTKEKLASYTVVNAA